MLFIKIGIAFCMLAVVIGAFGAQPFKEISKRFYSRIDPQNPLLPLIIRTKNLELF